MELYPSQSKLISHMMTPAASQQYSQIIRQNGRRTSGTVCRLGLRRSEGGRRPAASLTTALSKARVAAAAAAAMTLTCFSSCCAPFFHIVEVRTACCRSNDGGRGGGVSSDSPVPHRVESAEAAAVITWSRTRHDFPEASLHPNT